MQDFSQRGGGHDVGLIVGRYILIGRVWKPSFYPKKTGMSGGGGFRPSKVNYVNVADGLVILWRPGVSDRSLAPPCCS